MKTSLLMLAAGAAALSLAACNRQEPTDSGAPAAANETVNAAQDAVGAAVGKTSAMTVGVTTDGYATGAAISDMYEVAAGKMAQERSKTQGIKDFGKMMVTDHTATTAEMKPLAAGAQVTPPTDMDERRKGMIDNLRTTTDADFDRVYLAQQVAAHEEALSLHQGYADRGDNPTLKAFATKTAPKVQAHLATARALQATAGAAMPAAPPAK